MILVLGLWTWILLHQGKIGIPVVLEKVWKLSETDNFLFILEIFFIRLLTVSLLKTLEANLMSSEKKF